MNGKKRGYILQKSELKLMSHAIVHFVRVLNKLSRIKEVLIKLVNSDEQVIRKIVLPKSCVNTVLRELHDNIGHLTETEHCL